MTGPPKMRLPYASPGLRLVAAVGDAPSENTGNASARIPGFIRGVGYPLSQWQEWLGLTGKQPLPEAMQTQFFYSRDQGGLNKEPNNNTAFCWDSITTANACCLENEFQLRSSSLEALTIAEAVYGSYLSIEPRFAASYATTQFAAKLGEIRLVEAQRFVTDIAGNRYDLLNTAAADAAVLYLENSDDTQVIRQQSEWQHLGENKDYDFSYRIVQPLPNTVNNLQVHSVTVLEQYTSYFVQRPFTGLGPYSQWVPAYAPITWGWSLRVEHSNDGWVITRRKLILPVVGSDGWQLPQWQSSTLSYGNNHV